MKQAQNSLRKVFSLVVALGMFASTSGVGFFMPQVAEARAAGEPDKGDIWVCKTLLDAEGNLITGNDNSQKYTIKFSDGQQNPTINFNGSLKYDTNLFGSELEGDGGYDAECKKDTLKNALVGNYYYGEESIQKNPELYEAPRYHDGYQGQATNTSQLGEFDKENDFMDGHIVLNKGDVRVLVVLNQLKKVQSEVPNYANLHTKKVVCDDEADLPNWGAGNHADITASTAQNWVNDSNGKCEIVPWDFQWAPSDTPNPGDNLGNEGGAWTTFTGSTTIPQSSFGNDKYVWVREVFHPDYVPFTGVNTDQHVSAEVYCGRDGLHYDNYDRVDDLEVGKDYYCVGFNALKDEPTVPEIGRCELENGERWAYSVKSFNQGDRKDGTDVLENRSVKENALGVEVDEDIAIDYVSLGFGGEIVLEFSQPFVDAPGDDIKIYETSYGNPSFASYPEKAEVHVSSDGTTFTLLGIAQLDATFDLASIGYTNPVRFIKVKDISDPTKFGNDADGFDLAGVEVLACEPGEEPTQCVADLNLLKNPGFESPVVNHSAGWNIFASGVAGLEWLVEWIAPVNAPQVANAELHGGVNGWLASGGSGQYIELDSDYDGPGGPINGESASTKISQTVDTVEGETYTLSYDFSPRPGTTSADNVLKVWVNGVEVASHSDDGVGNPNTVWDTFSYSFEATGTSTTIAFSDGGTSNSEGTFLDNTSLECVPDFVTPVEPQDDFSITGNKTEVTPSGSSDGEGWKIYLLNLGNPLQTLEVDSESDTGTNSQALTNGEMYLVQASGTYKFGDPNPGNTDDRRADAEYSSELGDWTDAADTHSNKLDLVIDGVHLDWGVYTPTHTYYTFIQGDGSSVNFMIDDEPRWDNEGSLTVKIYALNGLASTITDSDGNYTFDNLNPGNYFIFEENQEGWTQIGPDSRSTDHCVVSFVEGSGTQTPTCDFVNQSQTTPVDEPGEGENEPEIVLAGGRSGSSGQFFGARTSTPDDDSIEGEVMGASTTYPGLPNAGVAPAPELVRTTSTLGAGFALYSLAVRRALVLRKRVR